MHRNLAAHSPSLSGVLTHPFWSSIAQSTKEEDLKRKRQFRAPTEAIERLKEIVQRYEGPRNFHNFTVGRDHADRSCVRIMKKIEVRGIQVHEGRGGR